MAAFFLSRIGGYVMAAGILILLIGGMLLHMHLTANTVAALQNQVSQLNQQAHALQLANTALKIDVANVQQAQQATNQVLNDVRTAAAAAAKALQTRTFSGPHAAIQMQINQETATAFKRLEDISNAP